MKIKPVLYHGDNLPAWWANIDDPDVRDGVFNKDPEYYIMETGGRFVIVALEKGEVEYIEKYKDSYPYMLFSLTIHC